MGPDPQQFDPKIPAKKCPYFTLPDVENLDQAEKQRVVFRGPRDSQYNSLIEVFGQADRMTDNQQAHFLLHVLKHASFTPDFEAAAKALNIVNADNVARRFKVIIQKQGFKYDEDDSSITGEGKLPATFKPARRKSSEQIKSAPAPTQPSKAVKRALPIEKNEDSILASHGTRAFKHARIHGRQPGDDAVSSQPLTQLQQPQPQQQQHGQTVQQAVEQEEEPFDVDKMFDEKIFEFINEDAWFDDSGPGEPSSR